jgi:zinc protease
MNPIRRIATTALAAVSVISVAGLAQVRDYRDIKTPPLHQIRTEQPKRIQLANGMVVFLAEDHELPLIRGTATVRGGSRDVPAEKAGLAEIYGEVWRTGGTETKTGDQLDDLLASRGSRIESDADDDSSSITFDTLKGDLDTVWPVFLDLLQHPGFRDDKIAIAKSQLNTGIARRNDFPQGIAAREAARLVYGSDSPYTRQPEYASVASITRDDLLAWHKRFVHPNDIIIGVVGDFDSAAMEKRLRSAFQPWPRGPQPPPPAADLHPAKPGVYFIPKADVTQSTIHLVEPGTMKNNPDYVALQVMNEIFGGGFSGRLMNRLRTEKGLAYDVGGGVGTEWDHPGMMRIAMGTKSGSTMESIVALQSEINDLQKKPVTPEELALAKESILNSFIFNSDSKRKVLRQRMGLEFYGYPADFYERYRGAVDKVTAADVSRVANKYIQPEKIAILVVGRDKDFDKPLSTLGTVTPIDISIPQPGAAKKSAAAAPPAASSAEGTALVGKLQAFVGGKARLAAIKSTRTVIAINIKTPQGPMSMEAEDITVYPDSVRSTMKLPMGQMTMVSTPEASFAMTPMGTRDLPSSQRESAVADLHGDTLYILANADKYTFVASGSEKVGDIDARVVEARGEGTSVKWWIDPAAGRLLRKSSQGRGPDGAPTERITDFSDWKDFGGINQPTKTVTRVGGEEFATAELKSLEINPKTDATTFARPAQ